ncbi:HAMP domain-containing sensor histidine kinase [Arenicella sp. 4NH20-0111]|uniref:sensor histidine kinase n=1 Tax=Arenicella sp. 4NH20-0111 TaxID=3127648 RepID=UPI0033416383
MNQISPFKSSAFRITLIYMLLFGLSVSIILGFVYWSTIVYTTNQTEEAIEAELKVLSTVYERRGYPGLVTLLSDRVRIQQQRPGDSSVYLLVDEQFHRLVGNISSWPKIAQDRSDGWLDFKLDDSRDGSTNEFTARARTFVIENRYNLLVGQGMRDLANLKELVGRALFWGLGLTLALGAIGGLMMRQTLGSRLSAINQTARKIMQGDLRKRIATKGSGDEFDELASNLNSMLDQIEGGMEGVRRVSDNIAHDLKTPLARLKNRVEELRFKVAGNIEQETSVDQILHEADGLLATFNALLRIARIEYSEQRRGFKNVDINSILYDIEELYDPLIEEKGQHLNVQLGTSIELWADRDMLFQAFANLIDNAIKYTPEKGLISIRSHSKDGIWYLTIADNGPGIPEIEHEKVVQRFYRLDQSRTTPGSGLGLALVFAVLKVHGMELKFDDNKPGLLVSVSTPIANGPQLPHA